MSRSLTPRNDERRAPTQRDPVRRVVHRAQDGQDLVHLLAVEERLAALHREAQARGLERLLEEPDLGEPTGQHHDVARPARPQARCAVAHRGSRPGRVRQERGEGARLGPQQVLAPSRRTRPKRSATTDGSSPRPGGGAIGS